tara:strand:- start:293 stop:571 length:279 start_codon:yes stop_codon:yes gene_type:complete
MKILCSKISYFFLNLFKKKKKQFIIDDSYHEMSEFSTFNLEKHNHIFKSQKNKLSYVPPTITETTKLNKSSFLSDSDSSGLDSDEFCSATQF